MFFKNRDTNRTLRAICLIGVVTVATLISCDKDADPGDTPGKAVVEAYLSPGNKIEVKITREIPFGSNGDTLLPITDLDVFIVANGVSHQLTYAGDAIYSASGLTGEAGTTYELKFEYNGEQVSSTTSIPQKPAHFAGSDSTLDAPDFSAGPPSGMPDPIVYSWDNPDKNYHLLVVTCIEPNPVEINSSARRIGSFRTEPTQATLQNIDFRRFVYYGRHSVVLHRIWSEYAALYDDGGSNSNTLTTPPGNIVNGWGIFTGTNVADSLFITIK
jgi:hypothetical protein